MRIKKQPELLRYCFFLNTLLVHSYRHNTMNMGTRRTGQTKAGGSEREPIGACSRSCLIISRSAFSSSHVNIWIRHQTCKHSNAHILVQMWLQPHLWDVLIALQVMPMAPDRKSSATVTLSGTCIKTFIFQIMPVFFLLFF